MDTTTVLDEEDTTVLDKDPQPSDFMTPSDIVESSFLSPIWYINHCSTLHFSSLPAMSVRILTSPFTLRIPIKRLLVIFCIINLLNYMDRGAIASNGVNGSTRTCDGKGKCNPATGIQGHFNLSNFEDGVLSSSFMVGLLIASPIYASLAKSFNPFRLIGVGLTVWTIAVLGCGSSFAFWFIVFCRMFVGVGEASFISLAVPFIDDNAPHKQKAVWLGVFYMCIPSGVALGYVYGGYVGKHFSWRYAFWGEAVLMAPFAVLGFLMKPLQLKGFPSTDSIKMASSVGKNKNHLQAGGNEIEISIETYKSSYMNAVSKSFTQFAKDMKVLCKEKVFVVNVLVGHYQRVTATIPNAFKLLSGATFLGAIFCFTAFTLKSLNGFIALFALGELLVFATQAPVNYVCLHCVEPSLRPLSMAISTVAIHIFGDVPSSPLVGIVQDHINSWRKTVLILTSVLFLAAAIWFIGIFINSVDRFNGEESESEKQRRQEQSICSFNPFRLIGVGLTVWTVAVLGCGSSFAFWFIVLCRMFVGVGEASFISLAAPFIDDNAPHKQKAVWLGVFYMCIPSGVALGYVYGRYVGKHFSWRYAFWGEAVLMAPFAVLGFLMKPLQLKGFPATDATDSIKMASSVDAETSKNKNHLQAGGNEIEVSIETSTCGRSNYKNAVSKSFTQFAKDMKVLCKEKVFVINVLGYVSYNFVIGAYSYWGPKAGYNIYKMKNADMIFGAVTIICGIIGTLSGGFILDRVTATIPNAFKLLSGATFLGAIFCFTAFTLKSLNGFIALFALGELLVFATQAPVNYVCLHCVEPSLRPLSMAISTIAIHIFGDVPSSPLVGSYQQLEKNSIDSYIGSVFSCCVKGIFINSVDRFNGEESESEKQRRQEQSIVTP
ncbi:unnamed protein product [Thlaspi arvense]|uniref:Major facilitator superfamily (MFS) profile domain-containing protein n=1 Tax=Thlaspi arvense TaxID=13288 RepID=A0AAU9SFP5_THLAR|nr:unnamed protein product [Thlaspi arvense]